MRTYHRWLSVLFGLLILWIAVTGVLSQVGELVNNGGLDTETAERGKRQMAAIGDAAIPAARAHEHDEAAPAPLAVGPAQPLAFVCPATMTCRARHAPDKWNVGFLHKIHSGEQFGPIGVVLSILSGLALIFFAFSGLWMYVQMYRRRAHRHSHPRRLFW